MASLRAESNQTTVVASLLARWIPFGALSLRSFRFFLLLFLFFFSSCGLSFHYFPSYPPFTCAHQPRNLFDYEDYFPLLNFPLTPLLHSASSSSALAPFLRIAGVLESKKIRRFSVLYFTS